MYTCVECGVASGAESAGLFTAYGQENIILNKCGSCGEIADKYLELGVILQVVDMILLKPPCYRHILINECWRPSFIWIFMMFLLPTLESLQSEFGARTLTAVKFFALLLGSVLKELLHIYFVCTAISIVLRTKTTSQMARNALFLASFPRFFHVLFLIWDFPDDFHYSKFVGVATFVSQCTALRAVLPMNLALIALILFGSQSILLQASKALYTR